MTLTYECVSENRRVSWLFDRVSVFARASCKGTEPRHKNCNTITTNYSFGVAVWCFCMN